MSSRITLTTTTAMPVTLLGWRPMVKGALRGFATVRIGRALKITDLSVLYMSFPGKPLISEGNALIDDRGKQRFSIIIEWTDRDSADRFSAAVVAAIKGEHGSEALEPSA